MNQNQEPHLRNYNRDKESGRFASKQIEIPMQCDEYEDAMTDSKQAKAYIDGQTEAHLELFPKNIAGGYRLHGWAASF